MASLVHTPPAQKHTHVPFAPCGPWGAVTSRHALHVRCSLTDRLEVALVANGLLFIRSRSVFVPNRSLGLVIKPLRVAAWSADAAVSCVPRVHSHRDHPGSQATSSRVPRRLRTSFSELAVAMCLCKRREPRCATHVFFSPLEGEAIRVRMPSWFVAYGV